MELLKDTAMEVAWLVWEPRIGAPALTVAVKATYDIPAEGACTLAAEQRLVTGDEHAEDDIERGLAWASDLELLKPRGEFWVVGSFHGGAEVTKSMAIVKVGAAEKSVTVTGERAWRAGRAGPPTPFTTMPLDWEHSFGGPSNADNPVGRGLVVDPIAGVLLLPSVEDPAATIEGGAARPKAFGLAPRPRGWSPRARFAGTYDAAWLRDRYPGLAEDLDYRMFLSAPEDQWIDGFWAGDEAIELRHLHPDHARVRASLPGHRAQVFAVDAAGDLSDVGMRLDTIAIDADAGQVVCVWRGLTELTVSDPEAPLDAVARLFVVHQDLGDRHSLADYAQWHARTLAAQAAQANAAEAEEPPALGAPVAESLSGDAPDASSVMAEIARRMAEAEGAADSAAVASESDAPGAKWAHLDQAFTVRGDDSAFEASVAAEIDKRRAEERAQAFRPVFDDALGLGTVKSIERELSPEEELELEMQLALGDLEQVEDESRARVRRALVEGESCAGWELPGVNLAGLDLSNGDFRKAILTKANLSGAHVRGARFDGASLSECELSDAVFEGVSFVGTVFTPVRAERVRFIDCSFEGVTAEDCYFRGARFLRCTLPSCDWMRSDLGEAHFEDCQLDEVDMSEAELEGARFVRSSLVDARLISAHAGRAVFDGCDCTLLRASDDARLEGASFRKTNLEGARFGQSKLRGADFSLARLSRADFTGALLAQAKMVGCVLRSARFDGATLVQASLLRSDLHQARFEAANLKHADLRGANLFQAELLQAQLDDARLDLADLSGTRRP